MALAFTGCHDGRDPSPPPPETTPSPTVTPNFTAQVTRGMGPLTVDFTNLTTGVADSHEWDFGDGSTGSTELEPSHTYTEIGAYTVSLRCRIGTDTWTETKSAYIQVMPSVVEENPIRMTNQTIQSRIGRIIPFGNTHTGGCAWVDYNNDFWPDLFITNGAGADHFLYRNNGDGTFTDVSNLVPKPNLGIEDAGVKFGDIDNDGDSDILVFADSGDRFDRFNANPIQGGPNLLYINEGADDNGNHSFTESAAAWHLVDPEGRRNICGALGDYDADGWLDVHIGVWAVNWPTNGSYDHWDRLLHNEGGTFSEAMDTSGIGVDGEHGRDALTCIFIDPNMDGLPDIYTGNMAAHDGFPMDESLNALDYYAKNQGDGTFVNVIDESPGVGDDARAAMGIDIGDIDLDGDWDLYITNFVLGEDDPEPQGNPLYLGQPDGTFLDNTADVAGVTSVNSWPCNFLDFDNDMWIDLWVGTIRRSFPDEFYHNRGDGTFDLASITTPQTIARGGSIADYDGDGDVDIFVQCLFHDCALLRNDSISTHHWLSVKLFGRTSNRDAIGALVKLRAGGVTQMRRVSGGDSAHSQQELIVHFGLNVVTEIEELVIEWPSGITQRFDQVDIDKLVFVDEHDGILAETLTQVGATYDHALERMTVRAESSFGGRTRIQVEGHGPLEYDAQAVRFEATFPVTGDVPTEVTLTTDDGVNRTVVVQ